MKSKQKTTDGEEQKGALKTPQGEFYRAITKHWKGYDRTYILKLFEEDSKRFKLRNVIQSKDLSSLLTRFRDKYYDKYLFVFLELQALSLLWPMVSWHQIHSLFQNLGIYNDTFTSGHLDALFRESTVPENVTDTRLGTASPQGMLRFEFMEFVMRVAIERYFLSLQVSEVEESLDLLFAACAKSFRGDYARLGPAFRDKKLLSDERILKVVEDRFSDLQLTYGLMKDPSDIVSVKRLISFLDESDLVLSEHQVWRCVSLSKIPILDELKPEGRFLADLGYKSLELVEFVEVLCRLALEEFSLRHLDEVSRLERKLDCLLGSSL